MLNAITNRSSRTAGLERALLPLLGIALIVPAMYLLEEGQLRVLIALCFTGALLILWHVNRTLAVCANFCFLFLLGDIRRIVSTIAPGAGIDPLLMVGAIFSLYVGLPLFRGVRLRDRLSKVMLALLGIMILEMFNPKQGSLLVGVSAGLFYIVPVIWFWIGRAYGTEELCRRLLYRVVVPLGVLAAVLGLYQTFVGFLPWEQAWIDAVVASGYVSILLHGNQARAFGFSVNGVEFVTLMLVTMVLLGAAAAGKRRTYLLPIPLVATATFFVGSRGAILKVVFGMAAVWAIRGYSRSRANLLPRIIFASAIGFGALFYSVSQASSDSPGLSATSTTSDAAKAHVVQGLAHPLDTQSSTAGVHLGMFTHGIVTGFTNPVGSGLGAATLAAGKFGGDSTTGLGSSEIDISDAFYTMGIAGGCCFLMMIFIAFQYSLEYTSYSSNSLAFALFGMLAGMLGAWLGLGQYAMAPLMLFCLGFLTKQKLERDAAKKEALSESLPEGSSDDAPSA